MKCPECDGTGTSNTCVNGTFKPCAFCDGTGEYEPFDLDVELEKLYPTKLNNEEWFCSLSTEEKAEFSMRVFKNCTWCLDGGNPKECPFNEFSEYCPAESKENMMKWLKGEHKDA